MDGSTKQIIVSFVGLGLGQHSKKVHTILLPVGTKRPEPSTQTLEYIATALAWRLTRNQLSHDKNWGYHFLEWTQQQLGVRPRVHPRVEPKGWGQGFRPTAQAKDSGQGLRPRTQAKSLDQGLRPNSLASLLLWCLYLSLHWPGRL